MVRSRSAMSSRPSSCSTSARDSARDRSGRGLRRSSIREKSAASQPCRCQYAAADRTASRETFQVDGARSAHWPANQAANASALISSGPVPPPNSATSRRRIPPYFRRVFACSAPASVPT